MNDMARSTLSAGLLLIAAATAGCDTLLEFGGTKARLDSRVQFVTSNGKPVADATIHLVERIGTRAATTEVTRTDARGWVFLNGYYCLPLSVVSSGGGAVIKPGSVMSSYLVHVESNPQPDLLVELGPPYPKDLKTNRENAYCG